MFIYFFFNDTATTEIYTTDTLFPYTTLFRSFLQCSWIPAFAGMTGKGISRRQRHRIETRKPGDGRRRGNRARRHSAHGLRHRMDMFGRGAAAAADHVDQPFLGPLTDEARR